MASGDTGMFLKDLANKLNLLYISDLRTMKDKNIGMLLMALSEMDESKYDAVKWQEILQYLFDFDVPILTVEEYKHMIDLSLKLMQEGRYS